MRHMYNDVAHWSSIFLMEIGPGKRGLGPEGNIEHGWLITGVDVQKRYRGQGYAADLLDRVCADADAEGEILYLDIKPDGTGLDDEALSKFYGSRGFDPWPIGGERARIRHPRKE